MKMRLRPIFKTVSMTLVAEIAVIMSIFIVYRLVAERFGPQGLGEYSLIKRVASLLQPLFLLGVGTGLPRFIAMTQSTEQRGAYIKVGASMVIIFTSFLLTGVNLFDGYFSVLFFGSASYSGLVVPFSLFSIGLVLTSLVYSYFQGRLLSLYFNLIRVLNLAVIPIAIIILLQSGGIREIILINGIVISAISIIFSLFFIREVIFKISKKLFRRSLIELFSYSLPRLLTSVIYIALISLGPIFAVHFASMQEVGFLSVSQNLLSVTVVVITPLSLVLLPKISNLIVQKRESEIMENVNLMTGAVIQCSIYVMVQMMIFSDTIILYWLGPEFVDASPVLRVILSSVGFYLFCAVIGNVLEAVKTEAVNLKNAYISITVFFLICVLLLYYVRIFSPIISISVAYSLGSAILGILTYISLRKIYPEGSCADLRYLLFAVVINLIIGLLSYLLKPFLSGNIFYLVVFEIVIGFVYLGFLWTIKADWLRSIPKKVFI